MVNIVRLEVLQRCKLEDEIVKVTPVMFKSREDQVWEMDQQIHLTWCPRTSIRSYEADFFVDPKGLSDLLLGQAFDKLYEGISNYKHFLTVKVAVSDDGIALFLEA